MLFQSVKHCQTSYVLVVAGDAVGDGVTEGSGVCAGDCAGDCVREGVALGVPAGALFAGGAAVVPVEGVNLFGFVFNVNRTPRLAFSSTVFCKSKFAKSTLLSPV